MKNTITPIKIGYLINKENSIIIPLSEGINEINSDIFRDNPKFKFLENLNFILFKIYFQANDKAYLRSYEQFPLHLRFEEKNKKIEEYFLCKSGIVTITSLYELQIKILNSKISFGTFNFEKNVEMFDKKYNGKLKSKELELEIIDLCTPLSDSLNTSSTIIQKNNEDNAFCFEEKKSELNLQLSNASASESEEVIYTSSNSDSVDKLADFSFDKSGDSGLEENKGNEYGSESVIVDKTLEGGNLEETDQITRLTPYEINNYNIIVIPKKLLSSFNEILLEIKSYNANTNDSQRNLTNLIKPSEIILDNKNDSKVKSSYTLRNKEKAGQLKLAHVSLPSNTTFNNKDVSSQETPTKLGKRRREDNNIDIKPNLSNIDTDSPSANSCMICLDAIKNPSKVNTCGHIFCKECIDQWTEVSNACPLCKKEFKKIIYYKDDNKVAKERKVRKKTFKIDDNDEESDAWIDQCLDHCMTCKRKEDVYLMLVCDKCHYNVCHTYCAGLDKIPEEDWLCIDCINCQKAKSQIQTRQANKIKN